MSNASKIRAILGEPFDWCEVPEGDFRYGRNNTRLRMPKFYLAKYPITYAHYQVFMNADDGYGEAHWWEGLATNRAREVSIYEHIDRSSVSEDLTTMSEQAWKIASHPRENVTWFQAMAFCRWLSKQLGGGFDLAAIHQWQVRLPTEFEWEKAASGAKGLAYPYGNRFDKGKSNTRASNTNKTTPVNQYPNGASPYGVLDMSGNVWEWCLSDFQQPQLDAREEDLHAITSRVVRGGAWTVSDVEQLSNRNRIGSLPADAASNIGFRLARSG
jgi:formylglycine-generating enzyme required for sulfatase activity